jgi:hypothetical protein
LLLDTSYLVLLLLSNAERRTPIEELDF